MGTGLEHKGIPENDMEASSIMDNGGLRERLEDKHNGCLNNLESGAIEMKASSVGNLNCQGEDAEVNILECSNSGDTWLADARCDDATENSSSFGNTISDAEDGGVFSDGEVVSESHTDATSSLAFDGLYNALRMRRKKLTSHWRTFIQPLMWRCKWVELQIKKFMTQAVKYDGEIAAYNQRKESDFENVIFEGIGAKSLPFSGELQRERVMRRNKRKRIEDSLDLSAYMLRHNLFSYYENGPAANGTSMGADWGNLLISTENKTKGNDDCGVNDELLSLEIRDGDNSLERILWEIGCVQSQIGMLKTRLDKLTSENAGMFSSSDDLSLLVPCNALNDSSQKPASTSNNANKLQLHSSCIASPLLSEYNTGDLVMHEAAVSNHGEMAHPQDGVESTSQSEVVGLCNNNEDGILLFNRGAKEELKDYKGVPIKPTEKPQMMKEEQECAIPPAPVYEDMLMDDQPPQKTRSISKLTAPRNRRARRRARSSRWSSRRS